MNCPKCEKIAALVKVYEVKNNPEKEVRGYLCQGAECQLAFVSVNKKKEMIA